MPQIPRNTRTPVTPNLGIHSSHWFMDEFLNNSNPFIRIGTAVLLIYGGLAFAVAAGIMPDNIGRNLAVLGLLMALIWNYGARPQTA